ncbi:hypothetical protein HMPREF1552_02214, partial [Leptotrichia sp. oral taxon 879 str. F0557]
CGNEQSYGNKKYLILNPVKNKNYVRDKKIILFLIIFNPKIIKYLFFKREII